MSWDYKFQGMSGRSRRPILDQVMEFYGRSVVFESLRKEDLAGLTGFQRLMASVKSVTASVTWKKAEERAGRRLDTGEIPLLKLVLLDPNIHKIAAEFGECLASTDLKISTNYLDCSNQTIGVEFPTGVAFRAANPGEFITSAYVYLIDNRPRDFALRTRIRGNPKDVTPSERIFDKVLMILLPIVNGKGEFTGMFDHLTLPLESPDIEECIEASLPSSEQPINNNLVQFIVKCLVYIQSGDPDLRKMRSPRHNINQRRWEEYKKRNIEASEFDLIYVGFNFKKPIIYSKDETTVRTHFRWQPHGPARSKVKWILIDEHLRHFNRKAESTK